LETFATTSHKRPFSEIEGESQPAKRSKLTHNGKESEELKGDCLC
jgi:hypothetical protein